MGIEYLLVNQSKKELISFANMNGAKKRELAGNPPQAALVTWYMLENQGDDIQFVSDSLGEWPFLKGSARELACYDDVTEKYINELVSQGILVKEGYSFIDKDDPSNVFVWKLKNCWNAE